MNCCFLCSSFHRGMASNKSEMSSSMMEYLEKERICEEMCKSITESVEKQEPISPDSVPQLALLPGVNTDDIEGILDQISKLLTPGENSREGEYEFLNDDRDVEEILKEAEDLVRSSTPFFERSGSLSSSASFPPLVPAKKSKPQNGQVEVMKINGIKERPRAKSPFSSEMMPITEEPRLSSSMSLESALSRSRSPVGKLSLQDLKTPPLNSTYTINPKKNGDISPDGSPTESQKKLQEFQDKLISLPKKNGDYEKAATITALDLNMNKINGLEEELKSKDVLINGYQKENSRLTTDAAKAKNAWVEAESKLLERVKNLENQLKGKIDCDNNETSTLKMRLGEARETIRKLELHVHKLKLENKELTETNEDLTIDVTQLRCEVEEYKKDIQEIKKKDSQRLTMLESNASLQNQLAQANGEIARKQTEIVRLNGEIGRIRGELERIRLGSVMNNPADALNSTINQLQIALSMERDNFKSICKEKEDLGKENMDLRRQVRELETIMKRRNKSGGIAFGSELSLLSPLETKLKETLELKNKELEQQLGESETLLAVTQKKFTELQVKYEHDINELEVKIKKLEHDSLKMHHSESQGKPAKRQMASKEDAHLLATIRGLKSELTAREKEIMRLNKELDDAKKTNRRLQKEREKALNSNMKPRPLHKEPEKIPTVAPSITDSEPTKAYNPILFEEDQDTVMFLRAENKTLRDEIKKLEADLISLHNKRIQDMGDLQKDHEAEMAHLLREQASKHSSSTVGHLQSQIYTQQMVISHLKQQVKDLEERVSEVSVLKAERDKLETTLIEANKKIARFNGLASPDNLQYNDLLEKLEFLERRHEVREQKLQSIVRDLIARQGQDTTCGSNCRDKLLNKNREICYYRAEMDRILDTLEEFRWSK